MKTEENRKQKKNSRRKPVYFSIDEPRHTRTFFNNNRARNSCTKLKELEEKTKKTKTKENKNDEQNKR